MLVLTQSQQMVINVEYVDCMFIGKEIIEKKKNMVYIALWLRTKKKSLLHIIKQRKKQWKNSK